MVDISLVSRSIRATPMPNNTFRKSVMAGVCVCVCVCACVCKCVHYCVYMCMHETQERDLECVLYHV